jgi:hypothetical protein
VVWKNVARSAVRSSSSQVGCSIGLMMEMFKGGKDGARRKVQG